jgi:hypothetical protein
MTLTASSTLQKLEYDDLRRLDIKREDSFLFGQKMFLVMALKDGATFVFQAASAAEIREQILATINSRK